MPSIKPLLKLDWFVGLVITLVFLLAAEAGWFSSFDRQAYNLGLQFSTSKEANEDIVVVAIDDRSLRALGAWPWSRDLLAEMTLLLARAQPQVIGFTMPLDSGQYEAGLSSLAALRSVLKKENKLGGNVDQALRLTETTLRGDDKLALSFKTAGRIVLAMRYRESSEPVPALTPSLPDQIQRFTVPGVSVEVTSRGFGWPERRFERAAEVFPPLGKFARRVGGAGIISDSTYFDSEPLMVRYGDEVLPSFALMMVARSQGMSVQDIEFRGVDGPMLADRNLGADSDFRIHPRFYQDQNETPAFNVFSVVDVLTGRINPEFFNDKIVIIGLTSTRLAPSIQTPSGEHISPTLASAHTISSLLNKEQIRLPDWADWASRGLLLLVGLYLMVILGRFRANTAFFLSLFLVLMIFNAHFLLMSLQATWLPMMSAVAMLLFGHLLLGARHAINVPFERARAELSSANRQLGVVLQSQGQLDQAFEKYRSCYIDDPLLGQIYNLGLDYERKRQFNKAAAVFKFLHQHQPEYNDVSDRIEQNELAANTVVLAGRNTTGPGNTLITTQDGMQKPKLGRYSIDREIGRGAMGMVYLGRDEKIGRTVAVKTMLLPDDIEDDMRDEVRSRFFREAEAAGRLNHPNIVTVYDVGDEQDLAYIAMDYLNGKDLTAYTTAKSLLAVSEVFHVIGSIALALDYAHQQHVVHRDIKPANIIYDNSKRIAKITDFGVACLTDASKTKTGTVLGSPYYMSPEQLAGKKVDGRADLFSLGVTMYQMLCGELPFKGESIANLMYNITNEAHPDIRRFRSDLPNCVNTLINKVLQKEAMDRYQTGMEMAVYMKRCQEHIREMEAA